MGQRISIRCVLLRLVKLIYCVDGYKEQQITMFSIVDLV